jgi:hypothetical protein
MRSFSFSGSSVVLVHRRSAIVNGSRLMVLVKSFTRDWNGTQLIDVTTMVEWAKTMTWKGLHPIVEVSRQVYEKGLSLSKATMREVEARLTRHPELPARDILIEPI